MKTPRFVNRIQTVTVFTLVVVAAFVCFYMFAYIPQKVDSINEERFRVLKQINENFTAKFLNERIVARSFSKTIEDSVNHYRNSKLKSADLLKKLQKINAPDKKLSVYSFTELQSSGPGKSGSVRNENQCSSFEIGNNLILFHFKTSDSASCITISMTIDGFMPSLLFTNIFDGYILVNGNEILYDSLNTGINNAALDSFRKEKGIISTSPVRDLLVGGVKYKIFIQPSPVLSPFNWSLCGLEKSKRYDQEKSQISSNTFLILLLGGLFLLLSLPFLKSLLMSRFERLYTLDVVLSFLSILLGSAIITVIMNDVFQSQLIIKPKIDNELRSVADSIENNFLREVDVSLQQMLKADSLINIPKYQSDFKIIARKNVSLDSLVTVDKSRGRVSEADSAPNNFFKKSYFKYLFWLNKDGDELCSWTTDKNYPLSNYADRDYFKKLNKGDTWKRNNQEFVLTPIYSWTTGAFRVGISIKSKHSLDLIDPAASTKNKQAEQPDFRSTVLVMSTPLQSVMNPVLPTSYNFCVIDESGEVLFHSDRHKNLNQNFFEEVSSSEIIQSSIRARRDAHFSSSYEEENYDMFLHPVSGLPLYIITFKDSEDLQSTNAQIFTFTFLLVLLLMLLALFMIGIVYIINLDRSKLHEESISITWLYPHLSAYGRYQVLIICNCWIIITSMILSFKGDQMIVIYGTFLAATFSILLHYIIFTFEKNKVVSRTKFLYTILFILIVLAAINYAACKVISENIAYLFIFQLVLIAPILIFIWWSKGEISITSEKHFNSIYALQILSWLMIVSIIPSQFYFRIAYNKERELDTRYDQVNLAQKLSRTTPELKSWDKNEDGLNRKFLGDKVFENREADSLTKTLKFKTLTEDLLFDKISDLTLLSYNDFLVGRNRLYINPSDTLWEWNEEGVDSNITLRYGQVSNDSSNLICVTSSLNKFEFPSIKKAGRLNSYFILFWGSQVLALFMGIWFIRLFTSRIFGLGAFDWKRNLVIDQKLIQSSEIHPRLMLIGLPFSGKEAYINQHLGDQVTDNDKLFINLTIKEEFADADSPSGILISLQRRIARMEMSKNSVVVLQYFEYKSFEGEYNLLKLQFLEWLLRYWNMKIILCSTLDVNTFMEKAGLSNDSTDASTLSLYNRWLNAFGCFYKIYYPLQTSQPTVSTDPSLAVIDRELTQSELLTALREQVIEYASGLDKKLSENRKDEEIILKIQSLAFNHYQSLWASLSKEEQYLVYDIAGDGLINTRNIHTIHLLLNKGIFIFDDGRIKIMNKSFRNFILTVIKHQEAKQLEADVNANGNWSRMRTPLFIILIAGAAFVVTTQGQSYKDVITYVSVIATGIPVLIKLLSSFGSTKSSS